MMNDWLKLVQLPRPCLLCGDRSTTGALCPGCLADLPPLPAAHCPICAESGTGGEVCGRCLRAPPAVARTRAACLYRWPLDGLIQRLKYAHELAIAPALANLLLPVVASESLPDAILPMPLHPERMRERGFNQAVEIARPLARQLRLPLWTDAARRVRNTPAQAGLAHDARLKNLRDAFVCDAKVAGRRIALLDDVMTTGASLDALARAVLAAGAAEVEAWVVARTP